MTIIRTLDPASCRSSGVCGVDADPAPGRAAADIASVRSCGADVERSGRAALPLALAAGEFVLARRHPDRAQLARWAGLAVEAPTPAASCRGGKRC